LHLEYLDMSQSVDRIQFTPLSDTTVSTMISYSYCSYSSAVACRAYALAFQIKTEI